MADQRRFYNVPGGAPPGSAPMYQQQTINPNMASGGPMPPTSSFGGPPPPSYGGPPPGSAPNGFTSPNSQGINIYIQKINYNICSFCYYYYYYDIK